jgi:hypothetical protein
MWKNQIFYEPYEYGQYIDQNNKIHTVRDVFSLENHNETYLNYEWRTNNTNPLTNESYINGDMVMNSRFHSIPLKYKGMAFLPSLLAFTAIGILIWYFGRWQPTPDDPHGGRLKKRHKRGWIHTSRRFFSGRSWSGRHFSPPGTNRAKASVTVDDEGATVLADHTKISEQERVGSRNYNNDATEMKNIDEVDTGCPHSNNNNI